MKAKRYTQRFDGVGFTVKSGERTRWACCDCGLVHELVFVAGGKGSLIGVAAKVNARATAGKRQAMSQKRGRFMIGKHAAYEKQAFAGSRHQGRLMAEPFFALSFEQIREILLPLRDAPGCANLYAWWKMHKFSPLSKLWPSDFDPLAAVRPTEAVGMEGLMERIEKGEWTHEVKIENHLLALICFAWGHALYVGPDGGDWGWHQLLYWDEWPEPNRMAWEAACKRAKEMAQDSSDASRVQPGRHGRPGGTERAGVQANLRAK